MARTKKTNKLKNKAAVTKKKTAKKKTVAKRKFPIVTQTIEAPLSKDNTKSLGYVWINRGEARIIEIALRRYLSDVKKLKKNGGVLKIHEWAIDWTERLIRVFKEALKKS